MNSAELRNRFFSFFKNQGHEKVESSSLVPAQDPTILFTNAGMNQFKDVFLGLEKRSYSRAVSIQKCMRAGGKHNDLDNVGFTSRHLTFFEMMGNFSFGDYFKKDAILFAWEFLTQELAMSKDTLHATVFETDDEAFDIWHTVIGLPKERIHRLGAKDNFWQMGDMGPCGPCTEILVDRGPLTGCRKKTCAPGCSCDRFLEIWNLVFMQFDRQADGSDKPLTQKGVDTGMGLERLAMIMQNADSVFATDIFAPLLKKIDQLTDHTYAEADDKTRAAYHVLADHIRAATFLISDGITPANDGRGYVLRKIIRRAALFAQKLQHESLFVALIPTVVESMKDVYPALVTNQQAAQAIVEAEVNRFSHNLLHGQHVLATYLKAHPGQSYIDGAQAFKLYDTYGFPLELTEVIAQEHNKTVDVKAFNELMEKQRLQSGEKKEHPSFTAFDLEKSISTIFTGYHELETTAPISALFVDNTLVEMVPTGAECIIVAEKSPFYVEKGGQVSDKGVIKIGHVQTPLQELLRIKEGIGMRITAPTELTRETLITQVVDQAHRIDIMNNHTATHLLQAALINVLGKEVKQSGSLVHPDYLRFDFTYHKPLTTEQVNMVEDIVNQKIRENIPVSVTNSTYKAAVESGVTAIFGEKYNPEDVRVIGIDSFSKELCGGTHVPATGVIGCFKITEEKGLSTGQRRIVALTGVKAMALYRILFEQGKNLSQEFKVPLETFAQAVNKQSEQFKKVQQQLKKAKEEIVRLQIPTFMQHVKTMNGTHFLAISLEDANAELLRNATQLLQKQKPGIYVASVPEHDKIALSISINQTVTNAKQIEQKLIEALRTLNIRVGGRNGELQGGGPLINEQQLHTILVTALS